MKSKIMAAIAVALLALVSTSAQAKHHHYRHHGGGSCDGIHRCICGSTQTRHFGLPRIVNGHNLWQAIEWTRAFPRTSPHAGAVGYQHGGGPTGHVFRVVSYSGGCTATVADERGEYERNICSRGATFVDVSGGGWRQEYSVQTHHRGRAHAHRYQVASNVSNDYMSRMGAGL